MLHCYAIWLAHSANMTGCAKSCSAECVQENKELTQQLASLREHRVTVDQRASELEASLHQAQADAAAALQVPPPHSGCCLTAVQTSKHRASAVSLAIPELDSVGYNRLSCLHVHSDETC